MKLSNILFVLRVTASVIAAPTESASSDSIVTSCDWNKKCFIICSNESEPAAGPIDGLGTHGIDWTLGVEWVGNINGYDIGSIVACGSNAETFVKRELDVGAHADWKDTLDVGAHVDWNNKADSKAEV